MHMSNKLCGRTAPPADLLENRHLLGKKTAMTRVQSVVRKTGRKSRGDSRSLHPAQGGQLRLIDTNQTEMLKRLTLLALSQYEHDPSITPLQYTYRRALPPSSLSHNTQKKEVRTKAHIRRAGGSKLSGVRNNSF